MSTTPTPRTDAVEHRDITGLGIVAVDFARQLERELQQATSELQAPKEWILKDSKTIGKLRADLARVAEERDCYRKEASRAEMCLDKANAQADRTYDALRARVVELVAALRDASDRNNAWSSEYIKRERDAAKRGDSRAVNAIEDLIQAHQGAASEIDRILARAESATPAKHCEDCAPEFGCWDGGEPCYKQPLVKSTPAKHPDTVRLDWIEDIFSITAEDSDTWRNVWSLVCERGFRAAIDDAMKGTS